MKLSIVIVNYKVKKEIQECIQAIQKFFKKIDYEIIIVENEENVNYEAEFKKYKKINYILSGKNGGYGAGCNLGAKLAKGDFLFFLNPDTKINNGSIASLLKLFKDNKAGVVAPLLLNKSKKPFEKQGTLRLTPFSAFFSISFISRIFPHNMFARKFYVASWNKKDLQKVDVVPGTAFIMKKELFDKVSGFDENFFLYFEESDLCNRIKDLGYEVYISPSLQVVHEWGKSTKQRDDIQEIFEKSRAYYFKKYYGIWGQFINIFLHKNFTHYLLLLTILVFAIILRFYRASENLFFDGEVGDNLLSIKNAYFSHGIPLLGPPTSHPWLSFGPFFYWFYAPLLVLSNFNPLSHAYIAATIGVSIAIANYITVYKLFNRHAAIISSYLIAISPLFLLFSRTGRFFTYIPLIFYAFVFLSYVIFMKRKISLKYFFLFGVVYGLMFHFHYTPLIFIPFILCMFFVKKFFPTIQQIGIFLLGFILSLFPLVIFNLQNKFSMLLDLFAWSGYRVFHNEASAPTSVSVTPFSFISQSFIPWENFNIQIAISILFLIAIAFSIIKTKKSERQNVNVLLLMFFIGIFLVSLHGSTPMHYYVAILPLPIIILSLFLSEALKTRNGKFLATALLVLITGMNSFYWQTWFRQSQMLHHTSLSEQELIAKKIIQDSQAIQFSLKRVGSNDTYDKNFSQNYIYLLWREGKEPVQNSKRTYTIYDGNMYIPEKIKNRIVYRGENILVTSN